MPSRGWLYRTGPSAPNGTLSRHDQSQPNSSGFSIWEPWIGGFGLKGQILIKYANNKKLFLSQVKSGFQVRSLNYGGKSQFREGKQGDFILLLAACLLGYWAVQTEDYKI